MGEPAGGVAIAYRPAPLSKKLHFAIDGGRLTCRTADDAAALQWSLALGKVNAAVLAEHVLNRRRFRRLDLRSEGRWYRIEGNFYAGPAGDTDAARQRALIVAVASALPSDLPVKLGARGGWRYAWFGLGLLALFTPIGILVAAIATRAEWEKIALAALPMLLLAAFGYALAVHFAPWRAPQVLPAQSLAALLTRHDATSPAEPDQAP
ncbi:MAG: hypothetical protein AAGC92_01920 [Pseudomonadota bacterium]